MSVLTRYVTAEWIYSELNGPETAEFYLDQKYTDLKQKEASGTAFNSLNNSEVDLLIEAYKENREPYMGVHYLTDIESFENQSWNKDQLAQVWVDPRISGKEHFVRFDEFANEPLSEGLYKGHPKLAQNDANPSFEQQYPALLGKYGDKDVLVDGYHRAVRFWYTPGADKFSIYVPSDPAPAPNE